MFGNFGNFDVDDLFKMISENIELSRDYEGVIIRYKNLPPGMDLENIRVLIENIMNLRMNGMMKNMMRMFGAFSDDDSDSEDGFDDDYYDDEDFDEYDNDDDLVDRIRIDVLPEGDGFKIIPDDPLDIDEIYDNFKAIMDPGAFQNLLKVFSKFFNNFMSKVNFEMDDDDADSTEDDTGYGDDDDLDEFGRRVRRKRDSNASDDLFYI
ncbi:MAG: hypothetical protein ACTSWN_08190 [Promethearchaeota archaeon]